MNRQVIPKESLQPEKNAEDVSKTNILVNLTPEERDKIEKELSDKSTATTLSASTGSFIGDLKIKYWWSVGLFYCYSSEYRIRRMDGQGGGDKANLTFSFSGDPNGQIWKTSSGDNLKQDGGWYPFGNGGWIGVPVGSDGVITATFTFDKFGGDPQASATIRVKNPN
ncbi:hypothetical protein [Pseudomonas sp. Ant30-3]|uniref:hypothetical protein n=1 Tax=Pseudomonas sp. Ant30-3 TaxID=1488328 RepID=UPI00067CB5F0|nr:hypothetical protein [Pseudomonas sp. Ant30-3]